ncbi:MAG: NPCBM/NEW2 domain-containing protein [Candidatus Nealsonbacteria bacterium]|nr:NPCBM/NEW2 domain-containing protein [Candidatus Nealsonbacteria bacterium]
MYRPPTRRLRLRTTCSLVLLILTAHAARADSPTVVPVDGKPLPATIAAITADGKITFDANGAKRELPVADLVRWGACREIDRSPIVVLADGGLLTVDEITGELAAGKEDLTARFTLFGRQTLPLELLGGVVFQPPAGRQQRDRLIDRVARATGNSDRLMLQNGDEITGLIEAIEGDSVRLKTDGRSIEIDVDRIAALIFNPDLKQATPRDGLRVWAGFSDGSRLAATSMAASKATLTLSTTGSRTWKTLLRDLVSLQPLGGRVAYLSDLKPTSHRHVPYLTLAWPSFAADRNITDGWLRAGGRLYLKGLGVHSAARLTYAVPAGSKRFEADLAVDDSTRGGGSVRFRVFLDGREKHVSETIRGSDRPVPVAIDLAGAKRLDLVVDYADRADQQDHANWLDARLVR